MAREILAQGAEAKVYREQDKVIKHRFKKKYRITALDERLRKERTKSEAKILKKIGKPRLISYSESDRSLTMEYIEGDLLREVLTKDELTSQQKKEIFSKLGEKVKAMHDKDIIHNDLTLTNIKLRAQEIVLLDFGLSFWSKRIEDKAVDIHVLKETVKAQVPDLAEELMQNFFVTYQEKTVEEWLTKVESRGRYKKKQQ